MSDPKPTEGVDHAYHIKKAALEIFNAVRIGEAAWTVNNMTLTIHGILNRNIPDQTAQVKQLHEENARLIEIITISRNNFKAISEMGTCYEDMAVDAEQAAHWLDEELLPKEPI